MKMAEEFAEIINKCSKGDIEKKVDAVILSITKIIEIFDNAMEYFDKKMTDLETKVDGVLIQPMDISIENPVNEPKKRRDLPEIPSQDSDKELENSAVKNIGKPSVRIAIIGELSELFEKRKKKLENKTN